MSRVVYLSEVRVQICRSGAKVQSLILLERRGSLMRFHGITEIYEEFPHDAIAGLLFVDQAGSELSGAQVAVTLH